MTIVGFMLPHIRALYPLFNISVISNTDDKDLIKRLGVPVNVKHINIVRKISLLSDLKSIWMLYKFLKIKNFQAIHTVNPKAGIVGMIAAWMARVPVRTHSFTGQVWANKRGVMRWILRAVDKIIVLLSTDVLIDSPSQHGFLLKEGVLGKRESRVFGKGSISGVDTKLFSPNHHARSLLRSEIGISEDVFVCLYLGRLNADKGVLDLVSAFTTVVRMNSNAELWLVGPDEESIYERVVEIMSPIRNKLRRFDFTNEPEKFMQTADLFCLPSYREGFGSAVIEAAACGIPSLASRIYGLTDAVVEGETGWMHEPGNIQDIEAKLEVIMRSKDDISLRGKAARSYVERYFEQGFITEQMKSFYRGRLNV